MTSTPQKSSAPEPERTEHTETALKEKEEEKKGTETEENNLPENQRRPSVRVKIPDNHTDRHPMPRQRPGRNTQEDTGPFETTAILPSGASRPSAQQQDDGSDGSHQKSKGIKHLIEKYGAIELENKGSVARDHLALERTFLAWLRTSLAFASIGIAITQLFRLNSTQSPPGSPNDDVALRHMGKPLGATFLGISIIVLVIGSQRYYESQGWLLKGKFPASRGSILVITLIAFLLIVASLIVVLLGRENH